MAASIPLCRFCGKPIGKRTRTMYFGRDRDSEDSYWSYRKARPRSKAEAQTFTNMTVVAVRWTRGEEYGAKQAGHDYISQASLWDGASYTDRYFCNGDHARKFAYAAAGAGNAMPDYWKAKRLREETETKKETT